VRERRTKRPERIDCTRQRAEFRVDLSIVNATGLRILVVDDDPDIALSIADGLELAGHLSYAAFDGTSALRLTEEFAPDVALLDIGLPDFDGFALAQRLHERHGKRLVIIAVTAYGDAAHKARAASAGFDAYLVKPVTLAHISTVIRDLMATRVAQSDSASSHDRT
jgi:DNA-binding response OmpR family regulator